MTKLYPWLIILIFSPIECKQDVYNQTYRVNFLISLVFFFKIFLKKITNNWVSHGSTMLITLIYL